MVKPLAAMVNHLDGLEDRAMKTMEFNESEQLALLAELARPLVHESNNFLNNLFMHMMLFQEHLPVELRGDWESVRREGKQLEHLLREWQSYWRNSVGKTGKIELNLMISEIVQQLCPTDFSARFTLALLPEPLWLGGRTGELQRFCRLLLQHLLDLSESNGVSAPLTIETGRRGEKTVLRILDVGHLVSAKGWSGFGEPLDRPGCSPTYSLTSAACRSMARHILGKISVECDDARSRCNLVVEFA